MTIQVGPEFDVTTHGGTVQVRGFSAEEVVEALQAREVVRAARAEHHQSNSADILKALMSTGIPLSPPASLEQAQRKATLRQSLVVSGVWTTETLAQLRGDSVETTRTWVSRRRNAGRLFTVDEGTRVLIPAFQIDEDGGTRDDLTPVLGPLLEAGADGWAMWAWLTRPTGLLSGGVPEQVAAINPTRAATAARRFAEQFR